MLWSYSEFDHAWLKKEPYTSVPLMLAMFGWDFERLQGVSLGLAEAVTSSVAAVKPRA